MRQRIISILMALTATAIGAHAQTISLEVKADKAVVNLSGAEDMTALQFNLHLPEGVSIDTSNATLGNATDGHTLCIEQLASGDLLFILYSLDLNTFMDGELLRFPITLNGADGFASLTTIRYASTDKVSSEGEDTATGVSSLTFSKGEGAIYNVSGQRLGSSQSINSKLPRGIYIKDGRKILK